MEFTNKYNLPQHIVDALSYDDYDHNADPYTISATTLMKPVKATILAQRHYKDLEMDVSDLAASFYGNAIHDRIERVDTPGIRKEKRRVRKINIGPVEYTISGKYDMLREEDDGSFSLMDTKSTSVWAVIYGGKDDDYSTQLSIYRWILLPSLEKVNKTGYIDFWFTDWSGAKVRQDKDYPQLRVHPGYEVALMSEKETEEYILSRLTMLEENRLKADADLTPCTAKELWAGAAKWAVKKPENKKASKVCDSEEEAIEFIRKKKIQANIEYRPPKIKRCKYCQCVEFCTQAQSYDRQRLIEW